MCACVYMYVYECITLSKKREYFEEAEVKIHVCALACVYTHECIILSKEREWDLAKLIAERSKRREHFEEAEVKLRCMRKRPMCMR